MEGSSLRTSYFPPEKLIFRTAPKIERGHQLSTLLVKGHPDLPQALQPLGHLHSSLDSRGRKNQTSNPQSLEWRKIFDQGLSDVKPLNDRQFPNKREIIHQGSVKGQAFQRKTAKGERSATGESVSQSPRRLLFLKGSTPLIRVATA